MAMFCCRKNKETPIRSLNELFIALVCKPDSSQSSPIQEPFPKSLMSSCASGSLLFYAPCCHSTPHLLYFISHLHKPYFLDMGQFLNMICVLFEASESPMFAMILLECHQFCCTAFLNFPKFYSSSISS